MGRRAWLIGLWLYGLAACVDFAYHLIVDVGSADQTSKYAEIPVAYSKSPTDRNSLPERSLLHWPAKPGD